EDIADRIRLVRDYVTDPDAPVDDVERAILGYACDVASRIGTTRPALPRRATAEATGYGERAVRNAFRRLHGRKLLLLAVPGRAGVPGTDRARAGLYHLPDEETLLTSYQCRETRPMGPQAQ